MNHLDSSEFEQEIRRFSVTTQEMGERLDKVLAQWIPEYSRGKLQSWIEAGHVLVNGVQVKTRYRLQFSDEVVVEIQPPDEVLMMTPEPIDFEVVYDTEAYLIVNKPVGLVVHPGAGNRQGTLLNGLLYRFPILKTLPRAGIVHRLDKDTSGLMVVAKTEIAQTHLVRQLQARDVHREYIAIVQGQCPASGIVREAIGRDRRNPIKMSVDNPIAPKEAITHFRRIAMGELSGRTVSMVLCRLETGRTHQIRVHLESLGHALLGDSVYGGMMDPLAQRQMLHARALSFVDPITNNLVEYKADMPEDMKELVAGAGFEPTTFGL